MKQRTQGELEREQALIQARQLRIKRYTEDLQRQQRILLSLLGRNIVEVKRRGHDDEIIELKLDDERTIVFSGGSSSGSALIDIRTVVRSQEEIENEKPA